MNIHEYIEKRAGKDMSLGNIYSNIVDHLVHKIGGTDPRSLRQMPAHAVQTVLKPIDTAKDIPLFVRDVAETKKILRADIESARKTLKSPDSGLSSEDLNYIKNRLNDDIQDLKDITKIYRNVSTGVALGYGALGYGGYKGGQKVKNYIQDKRRGQ